MCLGLRNRPTATAIFLNEARSDEAALLLDSAADMRSHGDTHRFTPGINRPPKEQIITAQPYSRDNADTRRRCRLKKEDRPEVERSNAIGITALMG